MYKFYDTCALLEKAEDIFESPELFMISNITLKELESIKNSPDKDYDIKLKARKVISLIDMELDKVDYKCVIVNYQKEWDNYLKDIPILLDHNNDSRIIYTALHQLISLGDCEEHDVLFVTADINCRQIAKSLGLNTLLIKSKPDTYTGFKEITYSTDEELADIYSQIYSGENVWDILINQYLIIKNINTNEVIDKYKYTSEGFVKVPFVCFDSKMFGKVKPKDVYQSLVMDSLNSNSITMIRGHSGTGKSYLAMGYLFSQLEKHKIEKIIIFCNTIATAGSAKLGFYPGTRTDKLMDSQIGNFLASKLGDKVAVERLIAEGKLELLPLSDIRGYDTSGLNAGIYITEAQNLDTYLIKLALQRIGEDSVCILDGDTETQVDSPIYAGSKSGMKRVSKIFRGDSAYGETTLQIIHRSHIASLAEFI